MGQQWPAVGTGTLVAAGHRATEKTTHKLQNNYTKEALTPVKVLGLMIDFPNWGSSKGTENPQGL